MSKDKNRKEELEHDPRVNHPQEGDLLNADTILSAEFTYAAQTAFQANEDRARVTSFYLVTVGSFLAAILSTQFISSNIKIVYGSFSILFLVISLMGVLTLLQLSRLRSAWFESISAMNQVKEFYIENTPNYSLEKAFRWRLNTVPRKQKPFSISFLLAFEVSLLGAFSFGAAIAFFTIALDKILLWVGLLFGGIFLALMLSLYFFLLRK